MTTDISVLEALFDLIDNAIDAARDDLLAQHTDCDAYGLPIDYSGYRIAIRFGKQSIAIFDNCLGIARSTLSKSAFVTAETSNHKFGIGHYGLGLKRSLMKFGSHFAMSTDTGKAAFKMRFDAQQLAGSKPLEAVSLTSSKIKKTLFVVSKLKPNVVYEVQNKNWFDNAIKMLALRYAVYTQKGLRISVSNTHLSDHRIVLGSLPKLRTDSKFHAISKPLFIDGVSVFIDAGVHSEYFFKAEGKKYSLKKNITLTDEFGLYFICNDRVIVSRSTASEHGWKTKWHSEYNGFVCLVRFVSENAGKIPWNTLKTALQTDGVMFSQIRDELQPIAEQYRQKVKKLYPPAKSLMVDTSTRPMAVRPSASNTVIESPSRPSKTVSVAILSDADHVKNWGTVLPNTLPSTNNAFLDAMLIDAKNVRIEHAPVASAMLLRAILEKGLRIYIQNSKNLASVKEHYYASSEGKKKEHSEQQKAKFLPDLAIMLVWLKDPQTAERIFNPLARKELALSATKTAIHAKKLNGIVHGIELIDTQQLTNIRNDAFPVISFLISSNSVE